MTSAPQLSKKKIVLFSVFTWMVVLTVINFICGLIVGDRYIALEPLNPRLAKTTYGYFEPNQEKTILFPGVPDYHVTINNLGFRITSPVDQEPKSLEDIQDVPKILCLGDSETFGNTVHDEETYPYQLQSMIHAAGKKAAVLNAGIGSGNIPDYLYYLKLKGLSLKPDVVVVQFFDNDVPNLSEWKKTKYEDMIDQSKFSLEKELKLMNIMRIFRKMELNRRWQRWIKKTEDQRAREILKNDSKVLDDLLYYASTQHGGKINFYPKHPELKPLWEKYFHGLSQVKNHLDEQGIELIFLIYPSLTTIFDYGKNNYQEILLPYLEENNITYVDLRQNFLPHKEEYMRLYRELPRDYHLGAYGKRMAAEEVYKLLKDKF